ncbi:putative spore wall protein [Hamiltosporidium magnivora]|nr:hypothetical protein CWI36_0708p0020 [Hamiltosporidium magnivora]TBU06108.1 putative spore wall protein [Hamiltosporidium magnivora]
MLMFLGCIFGKVFIPPEELALPPSLHLYDPLSCTTENKTYTVDLKVHTQDSVVKAIHSIATSQIDPHETEREAIVAYFGTIIDELNNFLIKYKVQLHLNLDSYNTDEFMGNISVDPSCEKSSPVIERTSSAFSYLKDSFNDNIGVHLFVWGCIYISNMAELETVYSNLRCGRVIGVLWKGAGETRTIIKTAIMDALTGIQHSYLSDNEFDAKFAAELCKYVTQCIGMDKSEIGQLVWGTDLVHYTDPVHNHPPADVLDPYDAVMYH